MKTLYLLLIFPLIVYSSNNQNIESGKCHQFINKYFQDDFTMEIQGGKQKIVLKDASSEIKTKKRKESLLMTIKTKHTKNKYRIRLSKDQSQILSISTLPTGTKGIVSGLKNPFMTSFLNKRKKQDRNLANENMRGNQMLVFEYKDNECQPVISSIQNDKLSSFNYALCQDLNQFFTKQDTEETKKINECISLISKPHGQLNKILSEYAQSKHCDYCGDGFQAVSKKAKKNKKTSFIYKNEFIKAYSIYENCAKVFNETEFELEKEESTATVKTESVEVEANKS
jgi:hypothetical protein